MRCPKPTIFCVLGLLAVVGGCATHKPPPFGVPGAVVTAGHYAGGPLTGPLDKAIAPGRPEDALTVHVAVVALERLPSLPGNSTTAAAQARLIAVTRSGVPVQAEARLSGATRLAEGLGKDTFAPAAAKMQSADLGEVRSALPAGVTCSIEVGAPPEAVKAYAGQPLRRYVGVYLYRPKGGAANDAIQLALVTEDLLTPPAPLDTTQGKTNNPKDKNSTTEPAAARPSPTVVHELLLLDRPPFKSHDQFALLVPYHFEGSAAHALVIFITLDPGSGDSAHQEAFAQCLKDLTTSLAGARAATQPFRAEVDSPEWPSLSAGLDAMERPGAPRQAMLYLAGETDVDVLGDVALIADDPTRQELAKKVVAKIGAPARVRTREGLAWVLENATFELLSEQSAAGKLAPELSATLAMHAGEAGRHPGALDEGLKTCANRQEFALRLIAENYIYLEDSSPASRVRAYDWLLARDRAPAGYDPLGPPRERRAALEKVLGAAAKPQAGAGGVR
jgi:hypothetical protein